MLRRLVTAGAQGAIVGMILAIIVMWTGQFSTRALAIIVAISLGVALGSVLWDILMIRARRAPRPPPRP